MNTPSVRGACRCGHACDEHVDRWHPGDEQGHCAHPSCTCNVAYDPVGVHASHCCARHGCKYGDADCPVATGMITQDYPCEICSFVDEQVAEALRDATAEQLRGELTRREAAHGKVTL